ncbi:MAG: NADH-quinone oxidoreductase subunit L [bacterium]
MMNAELYMLLALLTPLVGSALLPLFGRVPVVRNLLALGMLLTPLVCAALMMPDALAGHVTKLSIPLPLGFNFVLVADMLAIFMAMVSSLIASIIGLYSFGYISHYPNQNEYYFLVVLFIGSMMGIVFSGNLIFLFIFWELTAFASWRLIGFFRERTIVEKADKAFLITVFGALVMLIGFVMIYQQTGSFDLSEIKSSLAIIPLTNITVLCILIGILSKSAILPLHTWLPDAGVAPSPVTALLHAAVLVKIGVYVYARLFIVNFSFDEVWHVIIPIIAAVSALVSAGAALIETDLKRIIAFSTISQIGFILLGLSLGNEVGIAGGLLYILMHSIAKGGLFLCAGVVEQNTHEKDITKLGGLIKTMPVTAISFLLCAFSVMGIPPFGGFFSKYLVITGAVTSGQLLIAITFIVGAFLTLIYLFRVFTMVFLGEEKTPAPREGSLSMVFSVALLATLSLFSGLLINFLANPVQITVHQMLGMVK